MFKIKTPIILIFSLLAGLMLSHAVLAEEEYALVQIADPYIDIHTGPGRGFPVFYIAERGEWIEILKRKTTWFKIRLSIGKEGWVDVKQLAHTLAPDGSLVNLQEPDFEEYLNRTWEIGIQHGDLEGASVIAAYGGFHLTQNLSTELHLSQALGNFSEIRMASFDIINQPFPDLKPFDGLPYISDVNISPFFGIGAGIIQVLPRATLVQTVDREDEMVFVTAGARMYLTRRFLMRVEYRNIVILTSRDQNEEVEQWTFGFSVFF